MRVWLGLLVLTACASRPAVPSLPSQGGPTWFELETPYFTLWTDTSDERARELVTEMEHMRQAILGSSFASFGSDARVFAVAFRDEDEYRAFGPGRSSAVTVYAKGNALHQTFIVLPATSVHAREQESEAHELTHAITHGILRRQPRWFSEGMAQYFQTIKLGASSFDVGAQPSLRSIDGRTLQMVAPVPLRKTLACEQLRCFGAGEYVAAQFLVTYLINMRMPELARYMQLLDEGHGDKAFGEAFKTPVDELDAEVRDWIFHGTRTVRHYNVTYQPFEVKRRVLADADVLAVRVLLGSHLKGMPAADALARIDEVLRIQPDNLMMHMLATSLGRRPTADVASRLTSAMPGDWRAWFVMYAATQDRGALAKMCQLSASNPSVEIKSCESPAATKPLTAPPPPTQGAGVPPATESPTPTPSP